jgi:hypothetical protein
MFLDGAVSLKAGAKALVVLPGLKQIAALASLGGVSAPITLTGAVLLRLVKEVSGTSNANKF